jgi:hypothetical protein
LLLVATLMVFPPDVAQRLVGGALSDGVAYARLSELTDTIGPRLSGSPGAEAAVKWALQRFQQDGLAAHLEKVIVPHWVRGEERGEILASSFAVAHPLALTALGGSVGTPQGGIVGEVIEARSLEEIAALGQSARGKIIFLNHTMGEKGGYGDFVGLRTHGPSEAGKVGAAAVLLRSLATASLRSPHTGATNYDLGAPKIPGAAVSVEDAELIHRLLQRGTVTVKLVLGSRSLPEVESANVIAEVRGREAPDEVVLLGAHLDSWDLATGATDDGAGVAIVMEAGRLIAKERPRRTVRIVLFMNEENGLAGGKGYAAAHQAELVNHVAALEADSGGGRPLGVSVHAGEAGAAQLRPWLTTLALLGIAEAIDGEAGGADLGPLGPFAVPMISLQQDSSHYFETHHSAADTLDKVQPETLAKTAAAVALVAYALAEMPKPLPRPLPSPPRQRQEPLKPPAH